MITDKIKNLFQYIEFLHSNIDNFNKYNGLIQELKLLEKESFELSKFNNHINKGKRDLIDKEISEKCDLIVKNIDTPIENKAIELGICDFKNRPIFNLSGVEDDIFNLEPEDLAEILKQKKLYLDYVLSTHRPFLKSGLFFTKLEKILCEMFDKSNDWL